MAETASSLPRSASKRIAGQWAKVMTLPSFWPLILIVSVQAVVAVATLHNTAFQDEGLYLYAGRQILRFWTGGPRPLEQYAFYFSGYPYVYPVIGGVLDMIGGLELARWFSTFCMISVNAVVYFSTKRLFELRAAIFASATYASLGTVLFVSRLATFDALCLFLIALATAVAFQVGTRRFPWLAFLLGPLLVLSILAKYAAMIFVPPVLGIVVFCSFFFLGWRRMLLNLAIALFSLVVSLAVTYHFIDKLAFHAINGSTTNRTAIIQKSPTELFLHVLQMGGIVYAAALVGLIYVCFRYRKLRLIALVLFASSWLMPVYHIYKQEAVSIDKHMAFALFFAMPLAGYALAWLSVDMQEVFSHSVRLSWPVAFLVVLIVFVLGLQQSQALYGSWADTSNLTYVLRTQMRDASGRYLVEDIEVVRYDMERYTEPWQWNGVSFFYYVTQAGQPLYNDAALAKAISDDYFALVELSFNYQPGEAYFIAQQLIQTRNYDLIAKVEFQSTFGIGFFYIWRSAANAGHGNFTSLSQLLSFPVFALAPTARVDFQSAGEGSLSCRVRSDCASTV